MPGADWRNPRHLLAFGLGAGFLPKAPGTFGTLAAIPLYLVMAGLPIPVYLGIVVLLFLFGVWLCGGVSRDLGVHDHSGIVWDEVVGFLVTMTAAPPGWLPLVLGFALFRLFDIAKPWPIRWLDRNVAGGLGIMLDDVAAGIFGALVLGVILHLAG